VSFSNVLVGIFLVVYAALALIVLRQPLVGRLALREVVRRPGQTAILIVGVMVAGASIFAVQVAIDTGTGYVTGNDLAAWGRDDIEITAGGATFDPGLASRLAADPQLAQNAATFQNALTVTTSVTDLDRNLGTPGVQLIGLDLASEQRFGEFVLSDGRMSQGSELTLGRVFITQPLADALGAKPGDHLQVTGSGGPGSGDVIVAGIVQRQEAGAYGFGSSVGTFSGYRSIFSSLETAQQVAATSDVNLIRISARGDGDAEIARGHQMVDRLRALASGGGLAVVETKGTVVATDLANSNLWRQVYTGLGLIVVLAGSFVVINLAVMLAEERRPRLAVLRALGLTRAGLVKVAVVEGAIYSLAGSIAGLPLGLAIGAVMNSNLQWLATDGSGVHLSVEPSSLFGSVAAATLITLTTMFITSLRTSRMAISAAIRDLPEPPRARRTSWVRLALLVVGALAGAALLAAPIAGWRVLGGGVVIACAGGFIRGRVSERVRFTAIGAAIAAWAIGYVSLTSQTWPSLDQTFGALMGVVVAVAGISVLVASQLRLLEYLASVPGRGVSDLRATLRPALAYTSRRPLRSGLSIAAFAIIIALVTSVAATVTSPNYARDSFGYDVRVTEVGSGQLALPPDVQQNVSRQETLASRAFLGPIRYPSSSGPAAISDWQVQPLTVFGLTVEQLASGIVPLQPGSWNSRYHSAAEVWQAIASDPSLAVGLGTDNKVDLATAKGTLHLTSVANVGYGNAGAPIIDGLVGSQKVFDWLSASPPGVLLLLRAAPGVTPQALADQIRRATLSEGADATTIRQLVDAQYAAGQGVADLLLVLMRVGLLLGVVSLGTIAFRAVVERRRAIGVLRAIGFRPGQVLFGILLEAFLTATAGMAVGIGAAYSLGSSLSGSTGGNSSFAPDAGTMLSAIGAVYATVLLVTLVPAIRASRLRPAEALRIAA
jgi:putative ABC transport system permease protein